MEKDPKTGRMTALFEELAYPDLVSNAWMRRKREGKALKKRALA